MDAYDNSQEGASKSFQNGCGDKFGGASLPRAMARGTYKKMNSNLQVTCSRKANNLKTRLPMTKSLCKGRQNRRTKPVWLFGAQPIDNRLDVP